MVARLDAHQHFWSYNPADYPWMGDSPFLQQDYLPAHLQPHLVENGFHGCIAVQARQTAAETAFLLAEQNKHHFIKAVVGWIDLTSEDLPEQLSTCEGKVAGFRHQLEDEPDVNWMNSPAFVSGLSQLSTCNFTFDLRIRPQHLEAATKLVDQLPNQRFVIDHLAKPDFNTDLDPWRTAIAEIAKRDNVFCKISGMVTEADQSRWDDEEVPIDQFLPYVDIVLEAFTPSRLMFGSDWPVCNLAATFDEVVDIVNGCIDSLTTTEQQAIMGGTAAAFYGIDVD